MFPNDGTQTVVAAVKTFIANDTKGFPPMPGMIKEIIYQQTLADGMSALEAWQLVSNAVRCSLYNSREAFGGLPELVQHAVGNPANLRAWAVADVKDLETVIQSNFLKAYNAELSKAAMRAKTPPEVISTLIECAEKDRLEFACRKNIAQRFRVADPLRGE